MTEAELGDEETGPSKSAAYPPLAAMLLALLLVAFILPSALRLPQTNPTQTLEFAPVPPDDESDEDPPDGNVSSLGLGSSDSIEGEAEGGEGPGAPPPPPLPEQQGSPVAQGVECVDSPPRQTFDPLSPPCVPIWGADQDNGGATYLGVTGSEVRLLFYLDGNINYINASNSGNTVAPGGAFYDMAWTPEQCEEQASNSAGCTHLVTEALRVWQDYFNQRFQTYGRYVHFYLYFASGSTNESRRADAAKLFADVEPFAVVSQAQGGEEAFLDAMARKGVLNFGSFSPRERAFFDEFGGLIWSYLPSADRLAQTYVNYVCNRVLGPDKANPHPAVLADATINGQPRKLGMLYTNDLAWPGLRALASLVKAGVEKCGGEIVDEAIFEGCCLARRGASANPAAQQAMASFRQQGITTILWTGGINGEYGKGAASIGYFPEWIVLGDTILDGHHPIRLSDNGPSFDGHAVVVSPQVFQPALEQQTCYQAFREVNKNYNNSDFEYTCNYYQDLFQVFVGIQVAGPFLGPTQLDKGFRAIPQKFFGTPSVPACFYPLGDYSCVKDVQILHWDQGGVPPGDERPGCWRATHKGRRFAPDEFSMDNIDVDIKPDDPCTAYDARVRFSYT